MHLTLLTTDWDAAAVWLSSGFIIYFLILNCFYLWFIGMGLAHLRRYGHSAAGTDQMLLFRTSLVKPVSILVPAYNEERHIINAVRSLLALRYPQHEVVVIDDGSTDGTLRELIDTFELRPVAKVYRRQLETQEVLATYESAVHPNLVVVRKANGGKSDALNCGINISSYPYYCVLDADSVLETDALLKLMRPFVEAPDTTVAVGGIVRVANGCRVEDGRVTSVRLPRTWLPRIQSVEYLQAFLSTRVAFSRLRAVLLISGAFSLFRKSVVIEAGGYRLDTIGEDMELVVRLNRLLRGAGRPYRMCYVPDPVCWTEAPSDFGSLMRQRMRWQKGLIDSLRYNNEMLFNPRYGRLGLFAMPFYLFFELIGPVIELLGYVLLTGFLITGVLSYHWLGLYLLLAVGLGSLITIGSILLEEMSFHRYGRLRDLLGLLAAGLLYNFGFRQLCAVWRTSATIEYAWGKRRWGRIRRVGYTQAERNAPA